MAETGATEKFWAPTHNWRRKKIVRRYFLAVLEDLIFFIFLFSGRGMDATR